ncbi:unnamed protein product, partial [Rotaria sp. Silwood2]
YTHSFQLVINCFKTDFKFGAIRRKEIPVLSFTSRFNSVDCPLDSFFGRPDPDLSPACPKSSYFLIILYIV